MNGRAPCCVLIVVASRRLAWMGRGVWSIASSVRAGLSEQATKPRAHPGERSGIGSLQVADDQFHLAFEFDLVHGARGQQVAALVDGVALVSRACLREAPARVFSR